MGYEITYFKPEVQKIINDNKTYFDRDNSGTINKEEMVNLIFSTNANNEKELLIDGETFWDKKKDDFVVGGIFTAMTGVFGFNARNFAKHCGKGGLIVSAICSLAGLFTASLAGYMYGRLPNEKEIYVQRFPVEPEPPQNLPEEASKLIKRLKLPVNTPMIEYTPQKGEYWVSILKGKYGVDDKTAQKMTWQIKQAIYDDPKTAKQSPIIYLPKVWDFEGKRYEYSDSNNIEKTTEFSDSVKTEMGKMSKDIKY